MDQQEQNQQNEAPKEKPQMSLLMAYGTVREKMSAYLNAVLNQFPIPTFMVEGILASMLADVRSDVISQLSGERETFETKSAAYYEGRIEDLQLAQQDMIAQFEAGGSQQARQQKQEKEAK